MPPPPRNQDDDAEEATSITMVTGLAGGPAPGARKLTPYLIVLVGTHVGETFRLDQSELILGRSPQSSIRFDDDGVSRRHARLSQAPGSGGDWVLEDLS